VRVVCDLEQQLSRRRVLVTSAGEGWANRGSSVARIEVRREGEHGREGKRIGRGVRKVGDKGLEMRERKLNVLGWRSVSSEDVTWSQLHGLTRDA
jgi:hypothetical protein